MKDLKELATRASELEAIESLFAQAERKIRGEERRFVIAEFRKELKRCLLLSEGITEAIEKILKELEK